MPHLNPLINICFAVTAILELIDLIKTKDQFIKVYTTPLLYYFMLNANQ